MSASVDRIRAAGVQLKREGERLFVRGTLTDAQRQWIRRHRQDLIADLKLGSRRSIVEFQFDGDPRWYIMLGAVGESFEAASASCQRKFDNVTTIRERDTLPADFPFKRHDDDGEWKAADRTQL